MACGELNGHAIDDVKGHGHDPNALIEPNTSKTALLVMLFCNNR